MFELRNSTIAFTQSVKLVLILHLIKPTFSLSFTSYSKSRLNQDKKKLHFYSRIKIAINQDFLHGKNYPWLYVLSITNFKEYKICTPYFNLEIREVMPCSS